MSRSRWTSLLVVACAACGSANDASPDAGHLTPDASSSADAPNNGDVSVDVSSSEDASIDGRPDSPIDAGADVNPGRLVAYASGYGPDIQWLAVDGVTGALAALGSVASFGTAPSFLAVDPAGKHLYAVDENSPGRVGSYAIDPSSGAITFQNAVPSGGDGPPFRLRGSAGPLGVRGQLHQRHGRGASHPAGRLAGRGSRHRDCGSHGPHDCAPIPPIASSSFPAWGPTTWRSFSSTPRRAS